MPTDLENLQFITILMTFFSKICLEFNQLHENPVFYENLHLLSPFKDNPKNFKGNKTLTTKNQI